MIINGDAGRIPLADGLDGLPMFDIPNDEYLALLNKAEDLLAQFDDDEDTDQGRGR